MADDYRIQDHVITRTFWDID